MLADMRLVCLPQPNVLYLMYDQSFTYQELAKCLTQVEQRNEKLTREQAASKIEDCLRNSLWDDSFQFEICKLGDWYINSHNKHSFEYKCQNLVLRKLSKNVKRIYSVRFAVRNKLIRQISTLLRDKADFCVLRLDVSHFYESIDRGSLLNSLSEKGRISTLSLELLKKLFEHPLIKDENGLPRGLSVSAVLSELYMKYFDLNIQKQNGVYFYARYVDDIIIFCVNKTICEVVKQVVINELNELKLQLNESKTIVWDSSSSKNLEYLGYDFKKDDDIKISIALAKFNRIKTRITRSFIRYGKDHNFDNLELRIKYLTGNFKLKNTNGLFPIPVGLRYNYKYITNFNEEAKELDHFYKKMLFSKNTKFGTFTTEQRNALKKLSFCPSNDKKIWHRFTEENLKDINNCWL